MIEMGLGVIFPLLLILNLEMDPSLAGLALIPATIPMVLGAPLAGRWYDRMGGRPAAGGRLRDPRRCPGLVMAVGRPDRELRRASCRGCCSTASGWRWC